VKLPAAPLWWRDRGVVTRDTPLAVLAFALSFTPGLERSGTALSEIRPYRAIDALGVALMALQCLPLALRRKLPTVTLAIVAPAFAAHQALAYPPAIGGAAIFVVLYNAGAHIERHRLAAAVGASVAYVALIPVLVERHSPERPVDYLTFYAVLVASWAAGAWVRWRRREDPARAIAEERARISRELHDVVTHHVTAMVVQADAAQYLLAEHPDRVGTGLTTISETGRRALAELRVLLGALSGPNDAPAPNPGTVNDLVDRTRSAGQPVELNLNGTPRALAGGAEMAAYRVVQESLTNALKHAPGRRTTVDLTYGSDAIEVAVHTDGAVARASVDGRGLRGLRERVSVFGGDLRAGADPAGGFAVRARIPAKADA
jgi:signal transduction histidine kinase